MRYRHPVNTTNTYVPSATLRKDPKIDPNIRALLNAFPVSDQPEVNNTQLYTFIQSSPLNSDSFSLRLDQVINSKWTIFGRFAYAPSNSQTWSLAQLQTADTDQYTGTVGLTGLLTPRLTNQLNFNYSASGGNGNTTIQPVNGAVTPTMAQLFGGTAPTGAKTTFASWNFFNNSYPNTFSLSVGDQTQNAMRSFNTTDNLTWSRGKHMLKFGVDFRRLSPRLAPKDYSLGVSANTLNSLETSTMDSRERDGQPPGDAYLRQSLLLCAGSMEGHAAVDIGYGYTVGGKPAAIGTKPRRSLLCEGLAKSNDDVDHAARNPGLLDPVARSRAEIRSQL